MKSITPEPKISGLENPTAYIVSLKNAGTTAKEFIQKALEFEPPVPFIEAIGETTCIIITFDNSTSALQWLENINSGNGGIAMFPLGQYIDNEKKTIPRTIALKLPLN